MRPAEFFFDKYQCNNLIEVLIKQEEILAENEEETEGVDSYEKGNNTIILGIEN